MKPIRTIDTYDQKREPLSSRDIKAREREQAKRNELMKLVCATPIYPLTLDLHQYATEIGAKEERQVEWMVLSIQRWLKLPVCMGGGKIWIDRLRAPIVIKAAEDWLADYEKRNPAPRPLRVRAG